MWFGRECWPAFLNPTVTQIPAGHGTTGTWEQTVNNYAANSTSCDFVSYFQVKIPSSGYTCCDPGYILTATANGNQCVAKTAGANCTTPGFDGSCPPGTEPNGSGLCCGGESACEAYGWYWNFTTGHCQEEPWYCEMAPQVCGQGLAWNFDHCHAKETLLRLSSTY